MDTLTAAPPPAGAWERAAPPAQGSQAQPSPAACLLREGVRAVVSRGRETARRLSPCSTPPALIAPALGWHEDTRDDGYCFRRSRSREGGKRSLPVLPHPGAPPATQSPHGRGLYPSHSRVPATATGAHLPPGCSHHSQPWSRRCLAALGHLVETVASGPNLSHQTRVWMQVPPNPSGCWGEATALCPPPSAHRGAADRWGRSWLLAWLSAEAGSGRAPHPSCPPSRSHSTVRVPVGTRQPA